MKNDNDSAEARAHSGLLIFASSLALVFLLDPSIGSAGVISTFVEVEAYASLDDEERYVLRASPNYRARQSPAFLQQSTSTQQTVGEPGEFSTSSSVSNFEKFQPLGSISIDSTASASVRIDTSPDAWKLGPTGEIASPFEAKLFARARGGLSGGAARASVEIVQEFRVESKQLPFVVGENAIFRAVVDGQLELNQYAPDPFEIGSGLGLGTITINPPLEPTDGASGRASFVIDELPDYGNEAGADAVLFGRRNSTESPFGPRGGAGGWVRNDRDYRLGLLDQIDTYRTIPLTGGQSSSILVKRSDALAFGRDPNFPDQFVWDEIYVPLNISEENPYVATGVLAFQMEAEAIHMRFTESLVDFSHTVSLRDVSINGNLSSSPTFEDRYSFQFLSGPNDPRLGAVPEPTFGSILAFGVVCLFSTRHRRTIKRRKSPVRRAGCVNDGETSFCV